MKTATNTPLAIAFVVVAWLSLLTGVGAMKNGGFMGTGWAGGMMGSGWIGGISWMWIPTVLTLGLGVQLGWVLFGKGGAPVKAEPPTAHAEALIAWADDGSQGD